MTHSLKLRLITAAVLIPIAVSCVVYLETAHFALLVGGIICLGAWEWSKLIGFEGVLWRLVYVLLVSLCMLGSYSYRSHGISLLLIFSAVVFWLIVPGLVIFQQRGGDNAFGSRHLKFIAGLLVLVSAWLSVILLHSTSSSFSYILLFFLVLVWTADSSAYFAGKRWGRVKLADRVSPGKSWEGVGGALAATAIIVLLYVAVSDAQMVEKSIFFLICLLTVMVSVLGDLLESMMKRSVELKDSGGLLPGHGGILDRIDSLTAAAPVFFTGIWLMEAQL